MDVQLQQDGFGSTPKGGHGRKCNMANCRFSRTSNVYRVSLGPAIAIETGGVVLMLLRSPHGNKKRGNARLHPFLYLSLATGSLH